MLGTVDQYIRLFLAIVFISLSFFVSLLFLIGALIALVTGYMKVCPLYMIFGIKLAKLKKKK